MLDACPAAVLAGRRLVASSAGAACTLLGKAGVLSTWLVGGRGAEQAVGRRPGGLVDRVRLPPCSPTPGRWVVPIPVPQNQLNDERIAALLADRKVREQEESRHRAAYNAQVCAAEPRACCAVCRPRPLGDMRAGAGLPARTACGMQ